VTYKFVPLGPYALPLVQGQRAIDYSVIEDVISTASEDAERLLKIDLENSIGLYIFSLKVSGISWLPYYVGQAWGQALPSRAIKNKDKKGHYDTILQECGYVRASPCITFLPLLTPTGRSAAMKSNHKMITDAEIMLIGACKTANSDLWNLKHNKDPAFEIMGLTKFDRRIRSQKKLAEMVGF
jgi:hypothetical protein